MELKRVTEKGKLEAQREDLARRYANLFGGLERAKSAFRVPTGTTPQGESTRRRNYINWERSDYRKRMTALTIALHTGAKRTEQSRRLMSQIKRQKLSTPEARRQLSLDHGGVAVRGTPLILRGALNDDVMAIAQLERRQVNNLRQRLIRDGELAPPPKEQTSAAKRKSHEGRNKAGGVKEYTPDELNHIKMCRLLVSEDLVSRSPALWNRLAAIEERYNLKLPAFFADRLRFEVWLSIAKEGNPHLLNKYNTAGREIDPEWFKKTTLRDRQIYRLIAETLKQARSGRS